jgi:glutaminase
MFKERKVSATCQDSFTQALAQIWAAHHGNNDGEVASYIPELTRADPNHFGLAIATIDGRLRTHGDVEVPFTIQSVSKAFAFALATEAVGLHNIAPHVGLEPSADPFNAIVFDVENRPFNPMVNAGAIVTSAILLDHFGDEAFPTLLARFSAAAGRSLPVNEAVYQSESRTGERNRAIAHLLKANGHLPGDPDAVLDLYFRQCAIEVTAIDLALMGATAANMGQNPATGQSVFDVGCTTTRAPGPSMSAYRQRAAWAAVFWAWSIDSSALPVSRRAWIAGVIRCAASRLSRRCRRSSVCMPLIAPTSVRRT